jgi:hypothetical protein
LTQYAHVAQLGVAEKSNKRQTGRPAKVLNPARLGGPALTPEQLREQIQTVAMALLSGKVSADRVEVYVRLCREQIKSWDKLGGADGDDLTGLSEDEIKRVMKE